MIIVDRAISLTQPWASLMAIDAKRIETRGWRTRFRGWIAIHAAKGFPRDCRELALEPPFTTSLYKSGVRTLQDLPLGAVVAVVQLEDCRLTTDLWPEISELERAFGNYAPGRYGFVTASARRLREPIPMKGALGIWKLPQPITEDMLL